MLSMVKRQSRRREQMPTTTVQNGKAAAFNLAHLTAKAAGGKMLAEDLVEIGKEKPADREKGYEPAKIIWTNQSATSNIILDVRGAALGVGLTLGFVSGLLASVAEQMKMAVNIIEVMARETSRFRKLLVLISTLALERV